MCGLVDHYLGLFAQLEPDPLPDRWPPATNFRSPGKALLLMAVLDQIAHHRLHRNFVAPGPELAERFVGYQGRLPTEISSVDMVDPFIGLGAEEFWHLRPRARHDSADQQGITTIERMRECYYGAKFSDDLFPLLQMQTSREKLHNVLLESYFSPELQHKLRDYSSQPVSVSEQR